MLVTSDFGDVTILVTSHVIDVTYYVSDVFEHV